MLEGTAASQGTKGLMGDTVRTITLKHSLAHLITAAACPAQIAWPPGNNRVWKPLPLAINNHSMKITHTAQGKTLFTQVFFFLIYKRSHTVEAPAKLFLMQ